jgi:hypothetical protein
MKTTTKTTEEQEIDNNNKQESNVSKMGEVLAIDHYQVHKFVMYYIKLLDWFSNFLLSYYFYYLYFSDVD